MYDRSAFLSMVVTFPTGSIPQSRGQRHRRRLLAYIRRNDYQRYMALTDRLNIRRK